MHETNIEELRATLNWLASRAFELGQERDDLKKSLDATARELQEERVSLAELQDERDSLQQSHEALVSELEKERTKQRELESELDRLANRLNDYELALDVIFPERFYREQRPDLASYSKKQLIEHFCCHGIKEGTTLESISRDDERKELEKEKSELQMVILGMKNQARESAQQIAVLKDLFARLLVPT